MKTKIPFTTLRRLPLNPHLITTIHQLVTTLGRQQFKFDCEERFSFVFLIWLGSRATTQPNGILLCNLTLKGALEVEVEAAVISKSRPIRPWSCGKNSTLQILGPQLNHPFWFQSWIVMISIVCLRFKSTQHELNTFYFFRLNTFETKYISSQPYNTVSDKISSSPQYCLRQST